jgi:quinol monooxygenase YgiN
MKLSQLALIAAGLLVNPVGLAQAPAQSPENHAAYVVTYIEVAPSAKAEVAGLLKQIAVASRKEAGMQRFDVLQGMERDNQFAILEAWTDLKAQQAHDGSAAMTAFRDTLKPLRLGHYDERPSIAVAGTPPEGPIARNSIYTITHVDVTPQFKDDCIAMQQKLAEETSKEPRFEGFQGWQQDNRTNHFTVTGIWKDRAALDAHVQKSYTKEFREKLGPILGALYDERLYTSIE